MFRTITKALITVTLLTGYANAAEHSNARDVSVCAPDFIALGGYDVVSYRQPTGPVKGLPDTSVELGDLVYLFSSAENQQMFRDNPEQYLPSYRGWCSTNLAMGRLACPDYTNFKLENGRLLLFEHTGFTNGRDIWNTDPVVHKQRADINFEKFNR